MDEAKDLMEKMAASVRSGDYPPNYDALACRYCDFGSLCRRAEAGRGDDDDEA
jgi:CRISPR/Cas system-associated exonuclease Cas4 (RecB family)